MGAAKRLRELREFAARAEAEGEDASAIRAVIHESELRGARGLGRGYQALVTRARVVQKGTPANRRVRRSGTVQP